MDATQQETYNILCGLSGEQVVDILTDYLGEQILTDGLAEHLIEEGFASECDFSELIEEEEE